MEKNEYDNLVKSKNELVERFFERLTASFDLKTEEKFELDSIGVAQKFYEETEQKAVVRKELIAYLGESIIHNVGGEWDYCDDEKAAQYKSPVITKWGTGDTIDFALEQAIAEVDNDNDEELLKNYLWYVINRDNLQKKADDHYNEIK